ncbi:metal ABC transporter solute-binding protein, Zn/Mn family [Botrimarina mediterranea]|uniref:Periplasmic zinc-binding protein TroA n=1 Tax=Botrimarina mediterranea TaxID=2528022 RepID=A0A518K8V7_9BACT|nr:zinc ABC transporter substrate-binding protein [Botrimarina mediterranea]QDV74225.1 Periplasmic zinc-binding protein TroA precursor [Botrimarina mediterranea]QDV78856.1 Periplasmic zinc-binding protein TroA precursor [Planctomycetes bacterium K2D]
MRFFSLAALLAVVATISLLGCSAASDTADATRKPRVVATTGMVADMVRRIAGDAVEVTQIMGAGVDPHLYKATRDDVATILDADAVFYSGLLLEGKMADTFVKVGRSRPVYAVTELIDESKLLTPDGAEGHADPHVWMDVATWAGGIPVVRDALVELLPEMSETFAENSAAYETQLAELHAYARTKIATIPTSARVLVTSHDAFNYFGRAYDLEVLGVQGLSTESEAGLQRVNELVSLLVDRKVAAVFVESSVSPKNIRALIDGAASRGHEVVIGGELFSDAMGAAGTTEGTYVGMIDHNVTTVVRSLGGEADACGFTGKLSGCDE